MRRRVPCCHSHGTHEDREGFGRGVRGTTVRHELTAVFVQAEAGGYWAYGLEVPGAHGQGDPMEACEQHLIEGIRLLLAVIREEERAEAPSGAWEKVVEVTG